VTGCAAKAGICVTLSESVIERWGDFESAGISVLSSETLDEHGPRFRIGLSIEECAAGLSADRPC
jgi:hypothetical protein